MRTIYAARSLQRGGAVLAGGSDWPVTQLLPWRQIEMAITREYDPAEPGVEYEGKLNPSEALSRLDALKMHTQGAAYQLHLNAGAIAKGKLADLIVLDRNSMTIPETDIENTGVLMTMLGGQVVWEDPAAPGCEREYAARVSRPRSGSAARAAPADRRQEILDACTRVLARRGFAHTRMSDIAAEIGVTAPLLLHYFPSKNELITEALVASDEAYLVAFTDALAAGERPSGSSSATSRTASGPRARGARGGARRRRSG